MSYLPPHKRQSNNNSIRPSPLPDLLAPRRKKGQDFRNSKPHCPKPARRISWFPVRSTSGTSTTTDVFSRVSLRPVSIRYNDQSKSENALILVSLLSDQENHEETKESPSVVMMEKVKELLFASLEYTRKENLPHLKSTLVVKVGKNLFRGPPFQLERALKGPITEENMKKLHRKFYTSLPATYVEKIFQEPGSDAIFNYIRRKEIYHIMFSDDTTPDVITDCKCSIQDGNKISLYKAQQIEPGRDVVFDISCLDKDLDLRLKLSSRTVLTDLTDIGMAGYKKLIDSVIIDPNSDGGLRFPVVYPSSYENRYKVRCVRHTTTIYGTPSLKLKARHANRFDFRTGIGKVSDVVYFKLNGVVSKFQEEVLDEKLASDMLKDSIGLIWNKFLRCDPFL